MNPLKTARRMEAMPLDLSSLSPGDTVAGYNIIQRLGSSPLRETYEAEHPILGRRVAIKFCVNPELRNAFVESAKLMSRLEHPHITVLHDAGKIEDVPYIITEFVQGTHLGDLIEENQNFDTMTLLRIMQQVAAAIAYAHGEGVLHRNIKPQNIVIDHAGRAVLSDFEIAIPIGGTPEFHMRTPPYLAPEQAFKSELTEKVDIWGIGATLYRALSGRHVPYAWTMKQCDTIARQGGQALMDACQTFFEEESEVSYDCLINDTPQYVIKILEKCLAFNPDDRWMSMAHLSTGLDVAISQNEYDSVTSTVEFKVPREGETIIAYAESHGDELTGDYRQFELREFLADGHFGFVYKAWETFSEQDVAIKFLKPEHLRNREAVQRFRRESKLLSQVDHPNVIKLYSQGRYGATFFIAMQLHDGKDLESLLERTGALTMRTTLEYGTQMLAGIACLHEHGITHRDLKPGNMGFTDGRLVIGDFGLARGGTHDSRLTASGTIMGTVAYMPPEQVRGESVTLASDVYSAGMILYQMLTNNLPHEDTTMTEMMRKIEEDPIPLLSSVRIDVPSDFSGLVTSMLSKSPKQRPSAALALEKLTRWYKDNP